ncbi:MAG: 2-oxoacid:acceptor oxidoreductase subunit alpha, partial [Bacteroidetes bacterium]|nr:2-oxoacid:acceptor oxidoreductase subunit alpha [Bacteroidota bacterium]
VYTEDGEEYKRNMERLSRKWETAKSYVPKPQFYQNENASETGMLFFGTSQYSCEEAIDSLKQKGLKMDAMRLRSFPFTKEVEEFIASHKQVFVVEQNRDAQLKSLLMIELGINPDKLISILNFNGLPITAKQIAESVENAMNAVVS